MDIKELNERVRELNTKRWVMEAHKDKLAYDIRHNYFWLGIPITQYFINDLLSKDSGLILMTVDYRKTQEYLYNDLINDGYSEDIARRLTDYSKYSFVRLD